MATEHLWLTPNFPLLLRSPPGAEDGIETRVGNGRPDEGEQAAEKLTWRGSWRQQNMDWDMVQAHVLLFQRICLQNTNSRVKRWRSVWKQLQKIKLHAQVLLRQGSVPRHEPHRVWLSSLEMIGLPSFHAASVVANYWPDSVRLCILGFIKGKIFIK